MRHGVKKIKFRAGIDSNQMLMKKMVYNFVTRGKIVSTEKKIKELKSLMDILAHKLHENTESNKNYVMKYIPNSELVTALYKDVSPSIKERKGGYVKSTRLYQRSSDGTLMMRLEWSDPVVLNFGQIKPKVSPQAGEKKTKSESKKEAEVTK